MYLHVATFVYLFYIYLEKKIDKKIPLELDLVDKTDRSFISSTMNEFSSFSGSNASSDTPLTAEC